MKRLASHPFRVKRYLKLMALAGWIQNIPAKVTPPAFRLMQIGSAFWQSRALYAATRLQVADALGDTEQSTAELAQALGLHEDHLYRLLRMLASLGIFRETTPRVFTNSKASHYLREDNPANVRTMILLHNAPEMIGSWIESLEDCIRSGDIPFKQVNGADLFTYMDQNPDFDRLFALAMDSVENLTGNLFLKDFNWGAFSRIIDVGGSTGHKALTILKAYPQLKAMIFDRPQVIAGAEAGWSGKIPDEVLARAEFHAGNMFEAIPEAHSDEDLYVFIAIFHGLSDTDGKKILANLNRACGKKKPQILIADAVADEIQIGSTIAAFDMQMLMGTKGRERTLSEWRRLLDNSGFTLDNVVNVRTFAKFLLLKKA